MSMPLPLMVADNEAPNETGAKVLFIGAIVGAALTTFCVLAFIGACTYEIIVRNNENRQGAAAD